MSDLESRLVEAREHYYQSSYEVRRYGMFEFISRVAREVVAEKDAEIARLTRMLKEVARVQVLDLRRAEQAEERIIELENGAIARVERLEKMAAKMAEWAPCAWRFDDGNPEFRCTVRRSEHRSEVAHAYEPPVWLRPFLQNDVTTPVARSGDKPVPTFEPPPTPPSADLMHEGWKP